MNHFDREEWQIHAAFSQIEVKPDNLAERVRQGVGEAPRRTGGIGRGGRLLAAALVLLLVSSAALAVGLGGFERFVERFNPTFAEIVEPIESYSEDQGIRMTVIGAQRFDNMAVVYLSVQDVSGEDRLTEQMSFLDGFRLWTVDDQPGFSDQRTMLYFDEMTNTAYFEFQISADVSLTDYLEIGASRIFLHAHMFWDEPMDDLSLADLTEMETITLERAHMFTGIGMMDGFPESLQILIPKDIRIKMPHEDPLQWIASIGIVEGQFRVQYGGCYIERNRGLGPGDASFSLISPSGEIIHPVLGVSFTLDEDFRLINRHVYHGQPTYRFAEYFFDVDLDHLPYYTLAYSGQAALGISGDWRVRVDTSDTSKQMIVLSDALSIDGLQLEFIALNPLGLQVRGGLSAEVEQFPELQVYLETGSDSIALGIGGGIFIPPEQTFRLNWLTEEPLDIAAVTAVIINGHRIPVS